MHVCRWVYLRVVVVVVVGRTKTSRQIWGGMCAISVCQLTPSTCHLSSAIFTALSPSQLRIITEKKMTKTSMKREVIRRRREGGGGRTGRRRDVEKPLSKLDIIEWELETSEPGKWRKVTFTYIRSMKMTSICLPLVCTCTQKLP